MRVFAFRKIMLLRPDVLGIAMGFLGEIFVFIITLAGITSGQRGAFIDLFEVLFIGYRVGLAGLIAGILWGFLYGYALGFGIAYFYVFLVKRKIDCEKKPLIDLDFEAGPVSIIQEGAGANPYTLAIVANPVIYIPAENRFEEDPAIRDEALFTKAALRCLKSIAENDLLRLPEISSRLKIVAVYDKNIAENDTHALCEAFERITNVIAPREDLNRVDSYLKDRGVTADVVFVISGSEELTRSSARFSEEAPDNLSGKEFQLSGHFAASPMLRRHPLTANLPGVAAISAWDDRLKTPMHEFAHAMSSVQNGAILDEYDDRIFSSLEFAVNKSSRGSATDPVPALFAKYGLTGEEPTPYYSDRQRRDKEANWTSYVPEKRSPHVSCTMDLAYYDDEFDRLIFDFMYDRIMAKMERSTA
ncbi:MAG: hypothetical protein HUU32_16080 [Calditrichaceae bacterium]|nr:hypothetical protein [Calditrichia bacterium]NUQ42907.1 hypothetical protein [Calditrichaceae bacterium]